MILKTAASIAAAVVAMSPPQPVAPAEFRHGIGPTGAITFDLRLSPSAWKLLMRGDRLDLTYPHLSPRVRSVVHELIDAATAQAGICEDGWLMSTTTLDEEGTHHFRGVCIARAVAI